MENFISQLREKLNAELPGREAQYKMAHIGREILKYDPHALPINHRKAGVLLLLYPHQNQWFFPLIRRTESPYHGRQISFPGGGWEAGDANLQITALRESQEEIGLPLHKIEVLGKLTDLYIPVSQNLVHPYVGLMHEKPVFQADEKEVEEVIEVSIDYLLNPAIAKTIGIQATPKIYIPEAPYFDVHGNVVWGATAMILSEFLHILK